MCFCVVVLRAAAVANAVATVATAVATVATAVAGAVGTIAGGHNMPHVAGVCSGVWHTVFGVQHTMLHCVRSGRKWREAAEVSKT